MENTQPIGAAIKPLLMMIENALWEYELKNDRGPCFDDESFRAIIKLFACSVIERVWDLQENENMNMDDRVAMGEAVGKEIMHLIKVFTNINTKELYENI